jgi:hypothetical protein
MVFMNVKLGGGAGRECVLSLLKNGLLSHVDFISVKNYLGGSLTHIY